MNKEEYRQLVEKGRAIREEMGLMTDQDITIHCMLGCRRCQNRDRIGVMEKHEPVIE